MDRRSAASPFAVSSGTDASIARVAAVVPVFLKPSWLLTVNA
jgi:hypothetical protein